MKYNKQLFMLLALLLTSYNLVNAQVNKILFIKEVPVKMESKSSYTFTIGYDVSKNSDIAIDFSGGPDKFWSGKTVQVKKGKGVFSFKLTMKEKPRPGDGYRVIASIRDRGGDWKTTKAASVVNNVKIENKPSTIFDDASFSLLMPTTISSRDLFEFDINFKASQERLVIVTIWNDQKWIANSGPVKIPKGLGIVKVNVPTELLPEGKKYRFVLQLGSGEGFPENSIINKEISGIVITKPEKPITLKDLRTKSINLSLKQILVMFLI